MNLARLLVPAAALGILAIAVAQGVALKRTPKVGDAITYKLRMEFTLFGDTALYTSKVTERVTEVAPTGNYTVETSQTDYKVEVFGEEATVRDADTAKQATVFTPAGDVVEVRGSLVNDSVYRMANLTAVRLPDVPVKVGDTWTREVKAEPKTGVTAAKANYKVESEEKVGAIDAILASFDYAETEGSDPAKSVGKVWLNKADGTLVKLDTAWTGAPIPGAPSPLSGTVVLEREN